MSSAAKKRASEPGLLAALAAEQRRARQRLLDPKTIAERQRRSRRQTLATGFNFYRVQPKGPKAASTVPPGAADDPAERTAASQDRQNRP